MPTTALAPVEGRSFATVHELGVDDVVAQVRKIQRVMEATMRPGEHYGVIPGTGTKPTLLKPGAEKLCLTFRLDPQYEITQTSTEEGGHLTVVSRCTLFHIPTSTRMGSGMGSCSTRESKYAYRHARRTCPGCGEPAIIRGKAEWGGGWVCHKKQGGCGTKYPETDGAIIGQTVGKIPNPNPADEYNTVLKMANKRSLVAAVLNVTAASDIFTQDLEDLVEERPARPRREPEPALAAAEPQPAAPEAAPEQTPRAPLEEWVAAMQQAQTGPALHELWKACTAPAVWETWSGQEKALLTAIKDESKRRLGIT